MAKAHPETTAAAQRIRATAKRQGQRVRVRVTGYAREADLIHVERPYAESADRITDRAAWRAARDAERAALAALVATALPTARRDSVGITHTATATIHAG